MQPLDHGKAIKAVDDFVAMYKQRTEITSMSNYRSDRSLIPCGVLSGCIQTTECLASALGPQALCSITYK